MALKENLTNMNSLRIAKLYSIVKVEKLYNGSICGIETAKVVPFYVLIKKTSRGFMVVPTEKFQTNKIVFENAGNEHDLIVNKTRKNNRYIKPATLVPELANKKLTNEELIHFAKLIETVNAEFPAEYAAQKLKLACMQQNEIIANKKEELESEL